MACGGCGHKRTTGVYNFTCLNCGENFSLPLAGVVYQKDGVWYSKGMAKVVLRHKKCGSTNIKRI